MEPERTQYLPEGRQSEGWQSESWQSLSEGEHHVKGKFLPAQRVCYAKPTLETSELPTAIKEKIIPTERIEIQPVLQREREQLEIHQIQRPMREHLIHQTEVKEEVLPTKDIGEFREERTEYTRPLEKSVVEVAPLERETFRKPPIVEERVHKKIVEEIQPVIYRETEQPHLIRKTQPVIERVVEAPVVTREVLPTKDLGSHYVETKLSKAMEGTQIGTQGQGWASETYQCIPGEGLQYKEGGTFTPGKQYGEGWQYRPGETAAQFKESGKYMPYQEGWEGKPLGEGQFKEGGKFGGGQFKEGGGQGQFGGGQGQFGGGQMKEGGQFTGQYTGGQFKEGGQYPGGTVLEEENRRLSSYGGTTVPSEKLQV